jgi:membrane protein required for colicin V production
MFFGAIRGLLLVTIILLMISTTSFVKEDWWKSSCLIPYFKDLIGWMHGIIPDKVMHMTTLFKKS